MANAKETKKIRVGIVTSKFFSTRERGGTQTLVLLARGLQKRGFDCKVLAFDGGNFERKTSIEARDLKIEQGKCSGNRALDFFLKLFSIKKFAKDRDLLHVINMDLNLVAGFFSMFFQKKTIVTLNNYDFFYPLKISLADFNEPNFIQKRTIALQNALKRRIVMQCAHFVCLSRASKDFYERLGFNPQRLSMIPDVIDPLFEAGKKRFGGKRVLYVGGFEKEKGVEYLVRAMALVKKKEAELWLAGTGSEEQNLKKLTIELGLENKVRFLGWVNHEELPLVYNKCDVFVHPGIWIEPFGRTLIEAMCSGLPVIATRIGAPMEIVRQKELLCEPKNPRELSERIEFVLSNKKFADRTAKQNQKYVETGYSEERIIGQTLGLYERVLEKNN